MKTFLLLLVCIFFCYKDFSFSQSCFSGSQHSFSICNDGSVKAWGYNAFGQLGNGTFLQPQIPTTVLEVNDVVQISGGLNHSIFVQADGSVFVCGHNLYGQLGDGTNTDKYIPKKNSYLLNIKKSASGNDFSLFLTKDGRVYGAGRNDFGQLGDSIFENRTIPKLIQNLDNVIDIVCGSNFSLFLKSDGTVWICGNNGNGQLGDGTNIAKFFPIQIPNLKNVTQIATGLQHSLFLLSDGTVLSCGRNSTGQLGIGEPLKNTNSIPEKIEKLNDVSSIFAGGNHSIFLLNDGSVFACGLNSFSDSINLFVGNSSIHPTPVSVLFPPSSGKIIYSSAAFSHILFVSEMGRIWASGKNHFGQLGIGSFSIDNVLTPIISSEVCEVKIPTSIHVTESKNFATVFPNPVSKELTIEISNELQAKIVLFSLIGEKVLSTEIYDRISKIDVSTLSKGVYFLSIRMGIETQIIKIVIQ